MNWFRILVYPKTAEPIEDEGYYFFSASHFSSRLGFVFIFCNLAIVYHTDHFRLLLLLVVVLFLDCRACRRPHRILIVGSSVSSTGVLDIKDHCNKTVEIYEEISAPELTHLNRNRPLLCTYRFRSFRGAPRDWVLRIRFKKFKVGNILNATHCDGGYLQVRMKQFNLFLIVELGHFKVGGEVGKNDTFLMQTK